MPDYTSKVPKYNFSGNLQEQQRELSDNPIILRMAQSRLSMMDDPYRPSYHYVNPEGILNDPNGLCYWQNNWHLFYQGYPPEDPRQHWGHAVSKDLVHWQDLPYAIYPNPEEKCFSGSTFVEENRVIAMYHGTSAGNMIAISSDPLLLNWSKLTDAPVIKLHSNKIPSEVRVFDPCIWKQGNYYYSLSGGTLPHLYSGKRTRANFLFRSSDLTKWDYMHPFVEGDHFTKIGDDGACPYFWPIGDRHILFFFSHMSGGQALLGDYNQKTQKFEVTSHHEFNFGSFGPGGVHAPSVTPDGDGGVIAIFNMNAAMETPGWNQLMTLPRRISLQSDVPPGNDRLTIEPAVATQTLRKNKTSYSGLRIEANQEVILKKINGNVLEIKTEIDTCDSPMIELKVLSSPSNDEYTRISFYPNRGFRHWDVYDGWEPEKFKNASDSIVMIDTSYSSKHKTALSRPPESAPVLLDPDENLELRIFLDKSVIEVFVNGKQCLATRVYPSGKNSTGVSIRAQGSDAKIITMDAWEMEDIYDM